MAPVVELFNSFFRQGFQRLAKCSRKANHGSNGLISPQAEMAWSSFSPDSLFMDPIRLRCSGLRLREDHGSGWFLYETPVEACSERDLLNFKELIYLIEAFNDHVRESKLCQNATMKPFMNNQFAIVVLKQEGSGISESKLSQVSDFKCEGVEVSEIRLVRHKLQDKFGNAMFEVSCSSKDVIVPLNRGSLHIYID